ncbi:MAG TPA: SDR family oxidoreductase [Acidimicrobiales bacterium]|jgi:NAD(P)-dependent dehydrogenase (short-subunit alcohol dehydrogenase family)
MDNDELMRLARDVDHIAIDPSDILVTDRVAIVTGGGGGIGQGIALGLAKFGADVAVLDIEPARCEATVAAIEAMGRRALGLPTNVIDADQLRASVDQAQAHFGRLDILVNNAGGVRAGPFLTQPEASIRRHVDINLTSMLVATQQAVPHMIAGGRGGSIVNVTSIEGSRAAPMFAVYAACKAGMISFTKTMALELAEHDIRVNSLAPDHTISPGTKGNRNGPLDPSIWPDTDDSWAKLVPLGREGIVEECASAAVWLCSKMSEYVTGVNVAVDGGTWASSGWLRAPGGGWTLNP